jgi:riboflavin synthase
MFTGLIECKGIITRVERIQGGMRLEVYAPEFGRDMAIGDSIAVDGACLTVTKFIRGAFLADVAEETLAVTTLGELSQGAHVNLERALRFSDRLGGHIVTGHVDGIGTLVNRRPAGNSTVYQFRAPKSVLPYVAPKGSVAVDGVSLTVAQVYRTGSLRPSSLTRNRRRHSSTSRYPRRSTWRPTCSPSTSGGRWPNTWVAPARPPRLLSPAGASATCSAG